MEIKVYWILNYGPGRIGIIPRPRGGDWLEDEIRGLRSAGAEVLVSLLTEQEVEELDLAQEPTLCAQNGIEFLSFGIEDRGVPALDSDTTRFLGEVTARLLEKRLWLSIAVWVSAALPYWRPAC